MKKEFSMHDTILELLEQAGPGIWLFVQKDILEFVPEEYRTMPMEVWADRFLLPWGLPIPLRDLVEDANMLARAEEYWEMVPLWEEHLTVDSNDLHSVGLMIPKTSLEGTRPAALIVPGGGYEGVSFHNEGLLTAARLDKAGYRTFILNYRVSPNRYPAPQLDLALAIKYLRANAERYQIDPDDLMILGYSAGGHLCASVAALREELEEKLQEELEMRRPDLADVYREVSLCPDKVCLGYPVISFLEDGLESCFQALTGGDESGSQALAGGGDISRIQAGGSGHPFAAGESLREHLSIEKQVDPGYPKTFVWACEDDFLVPPSNAVRMANALAVHHVPHKLILYPTGGHGCGIAAGTSAEGWIDDMLQFMEEE